MKTEIIVGIVGVVGVLLGSALTWLLGEINYHIGRVLVKPSGLSLKFRQYTYYESHSSVEYNENPNLMEYNLSVFIDNGKRRKVSIYNCCLKMVCDNSEPEMIHLQPNKFLNIDSFESLKHDWGVRKHDLNNIKDSISNGYKIYFMYRESGKKELKEILLNSKP